MSPKRVLRRLLNPPAIKPGARVEIITNKGKKIIVAVETQKLSMDDIFRWAGVRKGWNGDIRISYPKSVEKK